MTGRELILYILSNNLEDEPVFKDGKFLGFMTVDEAAVNLGVGSATVRAWVKQGILEVVTLHGTPLVSVDQIKSLKD